MSHTRSHARLLSWKSILGSASRCTLEPKGSCFSGSRSLPVSYGPLLLGMPYPLLSSLVPGAPTTQKALPPGCADAEAVLLEALEIALGEICGNVERHYPFMSFPCHDHEASG